MSGVVVPINKGGSRENAAENKSATAHSAQSLVDLVKGDMEKVNQLILSKTGSEVTMIPQVANHLIDSGGKRLRPMLTIATAQMSGYEGSHHVTLAASVEFMHTATLLHDDVVDNSDMRRGKLAARLVWGNEASVLVGDFLLGQAFRMMVDTRSMGALDVLSRAATIIAEGEVMQLSTAKNLETTEDEYLTVIRSKTAALFGAACEVGPIIAELEPAIISAFRSYGANLGIAFQLVDDALDFGGTSAVLGKNVGDDLREGKVTLPILLAYRRGTDDERKFWKQAIEEGKSDDAALNRAMELLVNHNALADTIARAVHYGKIARDALAPLPAGKHKDALLEVIDFCIERGL
jgi:octaprenyl-diphosphate synthase